MIEVDSQLGVGTTFRIEIPETADTEEEIEIAQAA
jgi:signal transduction histidine kinase